MNRHKAARTSWRVRLRAALSFADHLAARLDAYTAACLDIRPVRSWGSDLAAWLGESWRAHLAAARIRRHGPGRGVIAVVINHPTTDTRKDSRER
ncbi:hypothetical protein ACFOVU_18660 [Nocardiopsis sediminis]|uniref:Transposase n=1 Tax=Nocardiopsis sediminis TaxID=1778267 RepID=A0ABV8FSA7_9ACTN